MMLGQYIYIHMYIYIWDWQWWMCFSTSHCVVTIRPLTNLAIHMKTIHYFNIYKYVFISFRRSTHKSTFRSWSSWPRLTTNAKLELAGFITVDNTSVFIIHVSKFFAVCHARRGLRSHGRNSVTAWSVVPELQITNVPVPIRRVASPWWCNLIREEAYIMVNTCHFVVKFAYNINLISHEL